MKLTLQVHLWNAITKVSTLNRDRGHSLLFEWRVTEGITLVLLQMIEDVFLVAEMIILQLMLLRNDDSFDFIWF